MRFKATRTVGVDDHEPYLIVRGNCATIKLPYVSNCEVMVKNSMPILPVEISKVDEDDYYLTRALNNDWTEIVKAYFQGDLVDEEYFETLLSYGTDPAKWKIVVDEVATA